MTELYKLLNIPRTASVKEIKTAYRLLAKELHPDVNKGSASKTARFRDIASAYEVLSNVESRSNYDRSLGAPEVRRPTVSNRRYEPPRQPYSYGPSSSSGRHDERGSPAAAAARDAYRKSTGNTSSKFNVEEWAAWHYGDQAIIDILKRRSMMMGESHAKERSKAQKKSQKEAEERHKEAFRTAAEEVAEGQRHEQLAKEKLAKSREARRKESTEKNEGFCSVSRQKVRRI